MCQQNPNNFEKRQHKEKDNKTDFKADYKVKITVLNELELDKQTKEHNRVSTKRPTHL